MNIIQDIEEKFDKKIKMLKFKQIKSYAPGISHYVFDLKIG